MSVSGTKREKKCKNPSKTFRPFREFAVRCLADITDTQLVDYMLQFTQTMKQETLTESALAKFLMYRALKNPYNVGQTMYWWGPRPCLSLTFRCLSTCIP